MYTSNWPKILDQSSVTTVSMVMLLYLTCYLLYNYNILTCLYVLVSVQLKCIFCFYIDSWKSVRITELILAQMILTPFTIFLWQVEAASLHAGPLYCCWLIFLESTIQLHCLTSAFQFTKSDVQFTKSNIYLLNPIYQITVVWFIKLDTQFNISYHCGLTYWMSDLINEQVSDLN